MSAGISAADQIYKIYKIPIDIKSTKCFLFHNWEAEITRVPKLFL